MHLEVREGHKTGDQLIANQLYISKEEYGSLDEIVERYLKPCNGLIELAAQHRKFKEGDHEHLSSHLVKEKKKDSLGIPYLVGLSTLIPQHLHLMYIAKDLEVTTEYVKVKPQGLFFHNQHFSSVSTLIYYFKQSLKTDEYQSYLKKYKAQYDLILAQLNRSQQPPVQNNYEREEHYVKQEKVKEERVKDEKLKRENNKYKYSITYQ